MSKINFKVNYPFNEGKFCDYDQTLAYISPAYRNLLKPVRQQ